MADKKTFKKPREPYRAQDSKPKPADGIRLDGSGSNWELFEQLFLQLAARDYGRLAQELTDDHDLALEIVEPEGEGFLYQMAVEQIKKDIGAHQKFKEDRPKLFGAILHHLSLASERRVRQHADFLEAEELQSPRILWRIVRDTHIAPQHVGNIGTWLVENQLAQLKQGSRSIEDHCQAFLRLYSQLLAMHADVNEEYAIRTFLISLNGPIFAEQLTRWVNNGDVPDTLDATMRMITEWYRTTRNALKAMTGSRPASDEVGGFLGKTKQEQQASKTRKEPHTPKAAGASIGTCPVCKKRATHPVEKCWELLKILEERDGKSAGASAAATAGPPAASNTPKPTHSKKAAWSVIAGHNSFAALPSQKIYLDTGATNSIWNSMDGLSKTYRTTDVKITGISGATTVDIGGVHPTFGNVIVMPKCPVNLLSLKSLRKKFKVEYSDEHDGFKLTSEAGPIYFDADDSGLYELRTESESALTSTMDEDTYVPPSVAEILTDESRDSPSEAEIIAEDARDHTPQAPETGARDLGYTKAEVAGAKRARELCRKLGHIGKEALIRALKSGSLVNSTCSFHDVHRAEQILGPCPGCKVGKMTRSKKGYKTPEIAEAPHQPEAATEVLHADIVFIPGAAKTKTIVLLSVGQRSRLVVASRMMDKTTKSLETAWAQHLGTYTQNDIKVKEIWTDCEANLGATAVYLASKGVSLHQHAAGTHEPHCERRVRTIKERMRSILYDLDYPLPGRLYWYLLVWAVQGMNVAPDTLNDPGDTRSARERVFGRPVDVGQSLTFGFGEVAVVHTPSPDALQPRGRVGIVVGRDLSTGNIKLYDPFSERTLTRRTAQTIPAPEDTLRKLTSQADIDQSPITEDPLTKLTAAHSLAPKYREESDSGSESDETYEPSDASDSDGDSDVSYDDEVEPEDREQPIEVTDNPEEEPRYNLRPNRGLVHAAFRLSVEEALGRFGASAKEAIRAELQQMLDLQVFEPMTATGGHTIPGSLFLKEKYGADGSFTRLKARFVAGGHRQEWSDEDDPSSPTVSWETVLLLLAVAVRNRAIVKCADVPTAYLHAKRDDSNKVVMKIDKTITSMLVELAPQWATSVSANGTLLVELKKAMYGLRESGLLWHRELSANLEAMGFHSCPSDPCLFASSEPPSLLAVYVDDIILITRSEERANEILDQLGRSYGKLTVQDGPDLFFLGVAATVGDPTKVTCKAFIEKMISKYLPDGPKRTARTPLPSNFKPEGESGPCCDAEEYRSLVMSIMYAAKRCRPDVLLAVSLLSTRVQAPTITDMKAAKHLLCYLAASPDKGVTFKASETPAIRIYADASFGTHGDSRSHSGVLILVMGGPVCFSSKKQRLVTKSTTAAEIVACDAAVDLAEWVSCLCEDIGFDPGKPVLLQDNTTAILTLTKGVAPKKHRTINIRHAYIKEMVELGKLTIEYVPTTEMKADGLTKPLYGEAFTRFRDWVVT